MKHAGRVAAGDARPQERHLHPARPLGAWRQTPVWPMQEDKAQPDQRRQLEADLGHPGTTGRGAARAARLVLRQRLAETSRLPGRSAQDRSLPPVSDAPAVPRRPRSRPPRGGPAPARAARPDEPRARKLRARTFSRSAIILRQLFLGGVQRVPCHGIGPPGDRTRRNIRQCSGLAQACGFRWPFPRALAYLSGHAEHHRSGRGDRPTSHRDRPWPLRLGAELGRDRQAPVGQPPRPDGGHAQPWRQPVAGVAWLPRPPPPIWPR